MSETLRIAPVDATEKTAQDAQGATIGTWGDLQVGLISGSRMVNEVFRASTILDTLREIKEGVDADVPVDATERAHRNLENCRQFSTSAHTHHLSWKKNEERTTKTAQPNCPPNRIRPKAGSMADEAIIKARIERVRKLAHQNAETEEFYEAASIAQSVIHDTVGRGHPSMHALDEAVKSGDWMKILGACKAVIALYDEGALPSPTLRIAHEIEGGILDIAQAQAHVAEVAADPGAKQLGRAISAFLAGAALEDALRRLCDAGGLAYDAQRSTIAKLQAVLYQPSKNIEVITQSENKQITVWGDTRNKADHGKFGEITQTEVVAMAMGVRSFVDKYLP